jgi:hypothetical protein
MNACMFRQDEVLEEERSKPMAWLSISRGERGRGWDDRPVVRTTFWLVVGLLISGGGAPRPYTPLALRGVRADGDATC